MSARIRFASANMMLNFTVFLKSSVSGLLEFKRAFYNTENMFDLGSHGRLRMLPFLGLVLTAFAELAYLAGATDDLIPNLLAGSVVYFGVLRYSVPRYPLSPLRVSSSPCMSWNPPRKTLRKSDYL